MITRMMNVGVFIHPINIYRFAALKIYELLIPHIRETLKIDWMSKPYTYMTVDFLEQSNRFKLTAYALLQSSGLFAVIVKKHCYLKYRTN